LAKYLLDDKLSNMSAKNPAKSLQEVVDEVGVYPADAYLFVQQGLSFTVDKIHGQITEPDASHHISGRDLCLGLREVAQDRWGFLARTVLERWNITSTLDFGRIVFAMVEHHLMQKTEDDNLTDFRQVYDFQAAFERDYHINPAAKDDRPKRAESKL
jgi:uncharacterized repeat protein (TIGR04138 family)